MASSAAENVGFTTHSEILPLLKDTKRVGSWTMAFCPAHEDGAKSKRRSLGLSNTGVLRCFAGCSFKAVMDGLREMSPEVRPEPVNLNVQRSKRRPTNPADLVKVYEYRDRDGKLIAQKGRFEHSDGTKSFKWRKPGETAWAGLGQKGLAGVPLYGAHRLGVIGDNEWVILCEGEKATEACWDEGLHAVCDPGGASTTFDNGEALNVLAGLNVALWPDNDEPGHKYSDTARRHLVTNNIAGAIKTIVVPLPPKGDAYDYFQAGGDVDDIFSDVQKATVEILADEHIRVTMPTESGPIEFDFDMLTYERDVLRGELTVRMKVPAWESEPYTQRVNLYSRSERTALELALDKSFSEVGRKNWTQIVNAVFRRVFETYREYEVGKPFYDIDEQEQQRYVMDRVFPRAQTSIVFADGGKGKTTLVYAAGLQIAMGVPFWGFDVEQQPVLIVDFETSEEQSRRRIGQLARGFGLSVSDLASVPIYRWPGRGIPLREQVDALKKYIRAHGIGTVIIDSATLACEDPLKGSAVQAFFAALGRLGNDVTSIVICHEPKLTKETKDSQGMKPYGSNVWHALSRRTWNVQSDENQPSPKGVRLQPRKVSEGRRPPPLDFTVTYGHDHIEVMPTGQR